MCACAYMAIQHAADAHAYGSDHSVNPAAYCLPVAAAFPVTTAARPPVPWALPSQTDRKHTTCVAIPAPTAMHAFMTEPSWPDVSSPPSYQFTLRRRASITS